MNSINTLDTCAAKENIEIKKRPKDPIEVSRLVRSERRNLERRGRERMRILIEKEVPKLKYSIE